MIDKTKQFIQRVSSIDAHTVGLVAVLLVAVSVTYGSAKIIYKNYTLEQEITKLKQENILQEQTNTNQKLRNQYYSTDDYLDIAARRNLNKSLPGETLVIVPESIAMGYTTQVPEEQNHTSSEAGGFTTNIREWLRFLSGEPTNT